MEVKISPHPERKKWVVNTPGSHLQRQPRTYGSPEKAQARAAELEAMIAAMAS